MREREGFLHFVKRCMMNPKYCFEVSSSEVKVSELNKFIDFIYNFYDYEDSGKGTNFAERFRLIFMDVKHFSYQKICGLIHIGYNPLCRWIEECNDNAVQYILRRRKEYSILMEILNIYNKSKLNIVAQIEK